MRFAKRRSPICKTPVLNFEEIGFGLAEAFRRTFVFIVFFNHNAHGAGLALSSPRALKRRLRQMGLSMITCAMVAFGFVCLGAVGAQSVNNTPRWLA